MNIIAMILLLLYFTAATASPVLAPDAKFIPENGSAAEGREGVINGIEYKYENDGSGDVGHWVVECSIDKFSGKKLCFAEPRLNRNFRIALNAPNKPQIIVGSNHYPNSSVSVRIDKDKPITSLAGSEGSFTASDSKKIILKMKGAETFSFRFMEWPYREWKDEKLSTKGFNEMYQYLNWVIEHIRERE